jgi:hypothetical protein
VEVKQFLIIAATIVVGLLALAAAVAALTPAPFDPVKYELQQIAIEQARSLAPVQTFTAAAWSLMPLAAAAAALVMATAWGSVAIIRFRHERHPDDRGLLPVPVYRLDDVSPQALGAYHGARQIEAARQPVPVTVTYSPSNAPHYAPHSAPSYAPRLDYRGELERAALPAPDEPTAGQPAILVPSFAQLLDGGRVGRGQPLLLGMDAETGAELPGAWLDLYATATAGLPGSGKTTSQRFFAAQTALHGARFVVCDPHASAGPDSLAGTLAPLRSVYLCEPAEEPKAILEAVRYVASIGEARKKGRDRDQTPIILWVDELTGLLGRSDVGDELASLLEQIAQEYRKKWVYLSASGQIWTASRMTSELRDSLASVLCHRMKRSQARLLLPTEEAQQVERLAAGEAILWRTSGVTTRVHIPNTTAADVTRVALQLGGGAPPVAAPETRPLGFRPTRGGGAGGGASGAALPQPHRAHANAPNLTAEELRIVAEFLGGKSPSALATELNGGKRSGDGFNAAARRVADILRRALGASG